MTLRELKSCVDLALARFDELQLYPTVRVVDAYRILLPLRSERDRLPEPLIEPFDALWSAFAVPTADAEPEPATPRFPDRYVARCEQTIRAFARAIDGQIAAESRPPVAPAEEEPEIPETGRAAAEDS